MERNQAVGQYVVEGPRGEFISSGRIIYVGDRDEGRISTYQYDPPPTILVGQTLREEWS